MSQLNELALQGVAAINEAYARDDIAPWRQHVEKFVDPELLLEGSREVFTEGDWLGKDGAIAFVANQMEVLKEMWMRLDEFIGRILLWQVFRTRQEALEAVGLSE